MSNNQIVLTTVFPDSSKQPTGWRIEQKYAPGVLIGNWFETNSGKFKRGVHPCCESATRGDYKQYCAISYNPDVSTRRKGLLINDGLSKDHIFTHHGKRHFYNRISTYDQDFNRRCSTGTRHWDKHSASWKPEASDHPIQGISTNFGLKEKLEEKIKGQTPDESRTTYEFSYRNRPTTTISRVATPRPLSANLHPHKIHKNLHLRSTPLIVRPEFVDPRLLKLSATL